MSSTYKFHNVSRKAEIQSFVQETYVTDYDYDLKT